MGAIKERLDGLYETDYYGWTLDTAKALRERAFQRLDLDNLIEEVESMGRSEQRELESRLSRLLMHLLRWEYQPQKRSRSWIATINAQRRRTLKLLAENPSLRPRLPEVVEDAYDDARLDAQQETGLSIETFPETCPYPVEQVLAADWLPTE